MRTGCGIINKYKCECKLRSDNISLIGTKTLTDQNLPMLRVRLALARPALFSAVHLYWPPSAPSGFYNETKIFNLGPVYIERHCQYSVNVQMMQTTLLSLYTMESLQNWLKPYHFQSEKCDQHHLSIDADAQYVYKWTLTVILCRIDF